MQLFHLHNQTLKKGLHSDFWLFETSIWLFVFGRSMVAVFIPIFLLQSGFTLTHVLLYYLLFSIVGTPTNFWVRRTIPTIGARWTMAIGVFFEIIFFIILFALTSQQWILFFLLAAFAALYDAFYWVSHLYIFAETDPAPEKSGKDTSILFQVKKIAGLLAPLIGVGLITLGGQQMLVGASLVIIVLSLIPLLRLTDIHDKPAKKDILTWKQFFKSPHEKKDYGTWSLYALHAEAETVLWPLFIFTVVGTIESVALVPVIVSFSGIFFAYALGNIVENKRERIIVMGSLLIIAVWILRLFITDPVVLYGSVFLVGLFELMIFIPLSTNLLARSKTLRDPLSAMTMRNASYVFFMFFYYGMLLLFVEFFQWSFISAIVALFAIVLINMVFLKQKNRGQEHSLSK